MNRLETQTDQADARAPVLRWRVFPFVVVVFLVGISLALVYANHRQRTQAVRASYLSQRMEAAHQVAGRIHTVFRDVYQGLRTVARLPGVRTIGQVDRTLSEDARRAIQEIYNNLSSNVDISEIYLIAEDFDPDAMDPRTGRKQEAIATFDQFITGRTADRIPGKGPIVRLEELEIHEYRLMVEQLRKLKRSYPTLFTVTALEYPAVGGREVVTCDNRRVLSTAPDDAARSGLVYSVPFYGINGALKGLVSGVLLTSVLKELLPSGDYALVHPFDHYTITAAQKGQAYRSLADVNAAKEDRTLPFSTVIPIDNVDLSARGWTLWVGHPKEDLQSHSDLATAARIYYLSVAMVVGFGLWALVYLWSMERNRVHLEERVRERTRALAQAHSELQRAHLLEQQFASDVAHELRTPIAGIRAQSELALRQHSATDNHVIFKKIIEGADRAARVIQQLLNLAQIEPEAMRARHGPVELGAVVSEVITSMQSVARSKEITLDVSALTPHTIQGDAIALMLLVRNLVENALRYSPGRTIVSIRLAKCDGHICLSVSDRGPGMSESIREQVMTRWYRGPDAAQQGLGRGLGLSIVARIANLHGASIEFVNRNPGPGTEVKVMFPGDSGA